MMFAVHVWDRRQRKLVEVRAGLQPLICDGENVAEGAIRQLAAKGHIATATATDESVAMKASPMAFWRWRRLSRCIVCHVMGCTDVKCRELEPEFRWHDLDNRLLSMLGTQLLMGGRHGENHRPCRHPDDGRWRAGHENRGGASRF